MITLEQIRLLESKITRAIDLIRVLKEENSTLRKGLESAQKRMRELETLVDGFKTDQKEIESVIVRTLHNLDELEESAAATGAAAEGGIRPGGIQSAGAPTAVKRTESRIGAASPPPPRTAAGTPPGAAAGMPPAAATTEEAAETRPPKEELDIF
jgi:FtsZ-binding cell division protein ZapB